MSEKETKSEYLKSFMLAFYQGRWVSVPICYTPKDAYDPITNELSRIKVKFLEGEPLAKSNKRDGAYAIDKKWELVNECLVPSCMSDEELEELKETCKINDIPFGWVVGNLNRKVPKTRRTIMRRLAAKERKNRPLNIEEFRLIRKELRKISPQSALVCEILWFVNEKFKNSGAYITLEEVVRLKVEAVDPEDAYRPIVVLPTFL